MHELAIALSLLEAALDAARTHGGEVLRLHLRLGALSGVDEAALSFAFEVAAADTPAAGARLRIESVPVVAWCAACRAECLAQAANCLRCHGCGAWLAEVRQGRELELTAVELTPAQGGVQSTAATLAAPPGEPA
ncbi:MAG: hydrogenase maturation nickel metallochaperone HypA [Terriglobales bacterium]